MIWIGVLGASYSVFVGGDFMTMGRFLVPTFAFAALVFAAVAVLHTRGTNGCGITWESPCRVLNRGSKSDWRCSKWHSKKPLHAHGLIRDVLNALDTAQAELTFDGVKRQQHTVGAHIYAVDCLPSDGSGSSHHCGRSRRQGSRLGARPKGQRQEQQEQHGVGDHHANRVHYMVQPS